MGVTIKKFLKYAFLMYLAVYPTGIGMRFVVEFFRGSLYKPCFFDVCFDWIPLIASGFLCFYLVWERYLEDVKRGGKV